LLPFAVPIGDNLLKNLCQPITAAAKISCAR
jgi:hypothetical protein